MKTYAFICWHILMFWNIPSAANSLLYCSLLPFKAIKHNLDIAILILPLCPRFHYTANVWRNALYSFRNIFEAGGILFYSSDGTIIRLFSTFTRGKQKGK